MIRHPAVAGQFYPGSEQELRRELEPGTGRRNPGRCRGCFAGMQ